MNKVILMGRLTNDADVRYAQGTSTAVAKFTLAVDRRFKKENGPSADFLNCTAFGKTAEFIEKYVRKGTRIVVEGRIENNNYTNKNGEKVYSVQIMVESVEFADTRRTEEPAEQNEEFVPLPQEELNGLPFVTS